MLEELEKEYAAGDASALWRALQHCAGVKQRLPDWVCEALKQADLRNKLGQLSSFNKVFGRPWTKGKAERYRTDTLTSFEIGKLASESGRDEEWFERVGRKRLSGRAIGKSKVKTLLADYRQRMKEFADYQQLLKRFGLR
jgi:hypothetical protein